MARKVTYEQTLVAHGWVALDPVDTGVIEKLFKKDIREGEENWQCWKMLLNISRSMSLHGSPVERCDFKKPRSGF